MEYGKTTPTLWSALQNALNRLDKLEKDIKKLKGKGGEKAIVIKYGYSDELSNCRIEKKMNIKICSLAKKNTQNN